MRPSMPAGESKNRSLAGPESTEKAWGTARHHGDAPVPGEARTPGHDHLV
jgi:hypothetical protein